MRPDPLSLPGLVGWWDFATDAPLADRSGHGHDLEAMGGAPTSLREGPWGGCTRLEQGQWLRVPRTRLGRLDLHGDVALTVVAWVAADGEQPWQFIAGVWDERDHRQYGLFHDGTRQTDATTWTRSPARGRVHAYVSREGGHTPGDPACFSYATGASTVGRGRWRTLGLTWDGRALSAWLDGRIDDNGGCNPLPLTGALFEGGADGADFTIGQRGARHWVGYPHATPPAEEGFSGRIAGVAVWARALDATTMAALHRA